MSARLLKLLAVAASLSVAAVGQDVQVSQYTCSTTGNYTYGSQYERNLDNLVSTLSTMAAGDSNDGWFHSGSAGGAPPDQAWGLIMCYADHNATQCTGCLQEAAGVREALCPRSRSMNVNYDGCLLRYADAAFLGTADTGTWLLSWVTAYVADGARMNQTRWRLLSGLAEEAGEEALQFGSGGERYTDERGEEQVVYGLAQCTRDLAPGQCTGCLRHALAMVSEKEEMRNSTKGSVKGFSCYVRYQVDDPFYVAAFRSQAAGAATPPGSKGRKAPAIVALAAAAGTVVMLLVAGV